MMRTMKSLALAIPLVALAAAGCGGRSFIEPADTDGTAASTGSGGTGGDPLTAPPTCTSGTYWRSGNTGSALMNPGEACITCHQAMRAPQFSVAGTVYPTGHEPDTCNGGPAAAGLSVVITTPSGSVLMLAVNSAGNFSYAGSLGVPYSAEVTYQGRTRAMTARQTNGDCNSCHTQQGASGAPGRIVVP